MTILHKNIRPASGDPNAGAHVVHYYTFTNTTNMNAGADSVLGGVSFTANDVGRIGRVGSSAPYTFYVLANETGPVWTQLGGGGGSLQVSYDTGSTITTDVTGNAVKIKYANANTDHTALSVSLAAAGTDAITTGNGLATVNYSPSTLRFGNVLRLIGSNLKEAMLALTRDAGTRTLMIDPASIIPGGNTTFSFTIQPEPPTTPNTAGIDAVLSGGASNPTTSNGGAAVVVGGQTGPGSTSGSGGTAVLQGGAGVGTGTLGGTVLINGGAANDGAASHGPILIGASGTLGITIGNATDNPSVTVLQKITLAPPTTGSNPNQYAQELTFTGSGLQTVGHFLSEVTPEGTITANPGSACYVNYPTANTNNGVWVKKTGTGNTGWRQLVDSDTLSQPASRTISGTTDTPTSADIGNVCHVSQAAGCTITVPDLSASLLSGREIILAFQAEGASTAMTFHCGAGVTINGSGSDYVATTGRTRISLMSRNGLAYFTG